MQIRSVKENTVLNIIRVVCSMIFPLITFPYISRTIGPTNYGKVNYCASIVSYFILVATFGISDYASREGAMIRDNRQRLNRFCSEVFSINLYVSVIVSLVYVVFVFGGRQFENYKVLLLIQGIQLMILPFNIEWFYTVFEDFRYITVRSIAVQVISLLLLICLVRKADDYYIYAAITVLSGCGASVFNFLYARKFMKIKPTIHTNIRTHLRPMIILLGHSIALTIYVASDTTMLGVFCGDYEVGIYSAATRIYLIVKQLLNAMIMVSVPRLSNCIGRADSKSYNHLLNNIFTWLYTLVLPCVVGLFCLGKEVMVLIGGSEYIQSGAPLKILSISLIFAVFACFFTQAILLPNQKEKYILYGSVASAAVNLILNFWMIPHFTYIGASVTTVIAEGVIFGMSYIFSKKYGKVHLNRDVLPVLVGCCMIFIWCIICKKMFNNNLIIVVSSILGSGVFYLLTLMIGKHPVICEIRNHSFH